MKTGDILRLIYGDVTWRSGQTLGTLDGPAVDILKGTIFEVVRVRYERATDMWIPSLRVYVANVIDPQSSSWKPWFERLNR